MMEPPGPRRMSYGPHRERVPDPWFPAAQATPSTVVLIHGGCWQKRYRRDLENDVAADLVAHGYAAWNVEYRRLGASGGWPECHEDVVLSIGALKKLEVKIDPIPTAIVG